MSLASLQWYVLIGVGMLIIALNRWLTQNYLVEYDRVMKWLHGPPLSISHPHIWWLLPGIAFILIGLAGLVGYIH